MVNVLILFATGLACLYITIVATYRDRLTPWFQKEETAKEDGWRTEASAPPRRSNTTPPVRSRSGPR